MRRHLAYRLTLLLSISAAQLPPTTLWTPAVHELKGPPAVCQPFAIGDAASLPWDEGAFGIDPGFSTSKLVPMTHKLLDGQSDALVRMETLRRAVIYAFGVGDYGMKTPPSKEVRKLRAQELILMLQQRALAVHLGEQAATTAQAMPPLFDLGYALSAIHQLDGAIKAPSGFSTGEQELTKSTSWSGASAAMHLGAGLGLWLSCDQDLRDQHFLKAATMAPKQSKGFQQNLNDCAQCFFNLKGHEALRKTLHARLAKA